MEHSSHLFEEGYGKGWLYQESVFIDFVNYHYLIFKLMATTRIPSGKKDLKVGYGLEGQFRSYNSKKNLVTGDYLLLVQKEKGFNIHIDYKEENLKVYHFVLKKNEDVIE